MRKSLTCITLLFIGCMWSFAQGGYEYYYEESPPDERLREPDSEMKHFLTPSWGAVNLFRNLSEFSFSAVRYGRRGYPAALTSDLRGVADISGIVSRIYNYSLPHALRRADAGQSDDPVHGLSLNFRQDAATDAYSSLVAPTIPRGASATLFAATRGGAKGVRVSAGGPMPAVGEDGYAAISAGFRAGRDPDIRGVFTQESQLFFGADINPAPGHVVSLSVSASEAERGLRSYATAEAFDLAGDNYYNPSWGYYGGRERSARTIGRLDILPFLHYSGRLSPATTLTAAAFLRTARDKRGGISWFDAQNPYPDYYRYMPGYESSNTGWSEGDPRATQIFWDHLVEQNLNRGGQAAYIVDERIERTINVQVAAAAHTVLDGGFALTFGVRHNDDRRRRYKELRDLLGAKPIRDVDQYLLDDDIFGEYHLNDSRNPERSIGEGDRFGYDYRLTGVRTDVHAALSYAGGRLRAAAGIEAGRGTLRREGFYEKELFPAGASHGRSERLTFNPYTVKAAASWSFSARRFLNFSASAAETMPYAGAVFLNPDYSNYAIADPQTVKVLSVDAQYAEVFRRVIVNVSAFATRTARESAVYRYWDDIESVYADMALTGIDKLYYGVEAAAQWDISPRFTLNFGASIGSYTYDSNPSAAIVGDATRNIIITNSRSYLEGCNLATSPQRAAACEVRYNSWGWIASLSASYMGGRYVDASPLRRMERAYGLAESPEKYRDFITQERLADAFVANFFLLRSFGVGGGRVTAILSVNNLLGNTDIIYNGYEQTRIAKSGSSPNLNWKPFASKYLYSYGRTYYISLSYGF